MTDTDTFHISVEPVNDDPVLDVPRDSLIVPSDTQTSVPGVSVVDVDSPELTVTLSVSDGTFQLGMSSKVKVTNNNTAVVSLEGEQPPLNTLLQTLMYTPPTGFLEITPVTVTVDDGGGGVVSGLFNIDVHTVTVEAVDDMAQVDEDQQVFIDILSNDTLDPSMPAVVVTSKSDFSQVFVDDAGTPGVFTDDRISYSPVPDFYGTDTFTYTITNGEGSASSSAEVQVNVLPVNDGPINTLPPHFAGEEDEYK